jgi:hypothetical protein
MSAVRIQDHPRVVSKVVAVAQTADGSPAMLGQDVPAWDYRSITWTGSNPTQIVYKIGGSGGTVVLTEDHVFDGSGNCTSTTRTYA